MAVATVRNTTCRTRTAARRREDVGVRVITRRRTRSNVSKLFWGAAIALVLVGLFGYVSVYVNLTTTGYNRAQLMAQCRQERIRNERLKIELNRLMSPQAIVVAAEKNGMVYATEYDYIQPKAVAQAEAD